MAEDYEYYGNTNASFSPWTQANTTSVYDHTTTTAVLGNGMDEFNKSFAATVGRSVVLAVVLLLSLVGNVLVCYVFVRKPVILADVGHRFVLNLACCDIGITLLVIPFSLTSSIFNQWVFGPEWCQGQGFIGNLLFCASILTLAVVSVDRFSAILRPLQYNSTFTSSLGDFRMCRFTTAGRAAKFHCTLSWLEDKNISYAPFLIVVAGAVPIVVMLFAYGWIGQTAFSHRRRLNRTQIHANASALCCSGGERGPRRAPRCGFNYSALADAAEEHRTIMVVSSNKDSPTVLRCLYLIKRAWNKPNSSNSGGVRLRYYIDRESSNGKNTHSCINTGMPADGGQPYSPGLDSPVAVIYTSGRRALAARKTSSGFQATSGPTYRKQDCKAARTIFCITSGFVVCWVPYLVVTSVELGGMEVPADVETAAVWLRFIACVVNPFIYGYMNRIIRKTVWKLFRRKAVDQGTVTTVVGTDDLWNSATAAPAQLAATNTQTSRLSNVNLINDRADADNRTVREQELRRSDTVVRFADEADTIVAAPIEEHSLDREVSDDERPEDLPGVPLPTPSE
ncbi:hypothetical protein Bbelb_055730 [Branchiostoma belcheri]|nr:hypothetical protein Bbelb_055730 [Branchiostoma belcheri]